MEAIAQRLKSNTYRVALIGGVLTIIEANAGLITALVPVAVRPYMPLIFPLAMMVMREVTTTALADK